MAVIVPSIEVLPTVVVSKVVVVFFCVGVSEVVAVALVSDVLFLILGIGIVVGVVDVHTFGTASTRC